MLYEARFKHDLDDPELTLHFDAENDKDAIKLAERMWKDRSWKTSATEFVLRNNDADMVIHRGRRTR